MCAHSLTKSPHHIVRSFALAAKVERKTFWPNMRNCVEWKGGRESEKAAGASRWQWWEEVRSKGGRGEAFAVNV